MISTLRAPFIMLVVSTILLFGGIAYGATDTTTSVRPQNCTTIDSNWKQYNQRIRGANTKVSDVVFNACAAIGGGCQFTSGYRSPSDNAKARGAKGSQHIQATAIDLRVPPGKEVEFMTLAICGLRKVNSCQGGLGYYSSKAIHVDTRTGRTNVWSDNFRRTSIAQNVSDPEAQRLLYGFGDGKCSEGSIEGDYSEEQMYGPPVEYTPPADFSQIFQSSYPAGGYRTLTPQQIASSLGQSTQYSTTGGGEALPGNSIVYRFDEKLAKSTGLLLEEDSSFENDRATRSEDQPESAVGKDNKARCEGSGLFGTNLFSTCKEEVIAVADKEQDKEQGKEQSKEQIGDGLTKTFEQNPARNFVGDIPLALRGENDYVYDDETGEVQRVRTIGGSVDVFYGVHNPQDSGPVSPGVSPQNVNLIGYGQFVPGEARTVTREMPTIIQNSTRFAQRSAQLGAYYGLVYGTSPLIIGSAPRTLVRLVQNGLGARVYNPFSI